MAVATTNVKTLAAVVQEGKVLPLAAAMAWGQANGAWLKKIIDDHKTLLEDMEVEKFQKAYDGSLESIETRDKSRGDDTNNKLLPNYAALIIDTPVDYMLGKMFMVTVEDPEQADAETKESEIATAYRKDLTKEIVSDHSKRVLMEQLRQGGIAGYNCVIAWVNEKGKIDYEEFPVQETVPVFDARGRLLMVVRYYTTEIPVNDTETKEVTKVEVYDDRYITYYISNESGEGYDLDTMELVQVQGKEPTGNPVAHGAARIPVSVYINGTPARYEARQRKAGTSDLANGVYTLLEAYAAGISDKANLADYLQDQFLALIGVDTTEGEVIKMRKARAIELKGNKNESDVKFIAQDQADGAVEHFLDRIEKAIFDTTLTPRMNDLAGATATEIKMKYAGLDIKVGKKETYFMESLRQFVATITDMLNTRRLVEAGTLPEDVYDILTGVTASPKSVVLYNPDWVSITLNRNLPQNYKEIADIVAVLAGKVPDSYLYELLWFIDDPVKALEEMKAQKAQALKDNMAAMGYSEDSFGSQNTGDENPDDSTA